MTLTATPVGTAIFTPARPTTTITVKDGTQIYYKDWSAGQPVVFSHGWPLNSDSWEAQMLFVQWLRLSSRHRIDTAACPLSLVLRRMNSSTRFVIQLVLQPIPVMAD